jgi:glyoxylase-like metal-dependent hydrolase (beta-lactamase superfamily II)
MGNKLVEFLSALTTSAKEVSQDILVLEFRVVTACLVGKPEGENSKWILVDTGLENSGDYILETTSSRFGEGSRPQAIILTHGHFDHVGSVKQLAEDWDVPVYAHSLELPYLTGMKDYPLADPTVGGGIVAEMSPTFPHTRIDLGHRIIALPEDGRVPGMPGWDWVHTPGHTEGHISLFREIDRVLLAADALTTVKQESLWSVLTQEEQMSGPPAYFTMDWQTAEQSVNKLRDLNPSLVIPSHGQPMEGEELYRHLNYLVKHFGEIAVPEQGRFVNHPPES